MSIHKGTSILLYFRNKIQSYLMKSIPLLLFLFFLIFGYSQENEKPYSHWLKKVQEFNRVNNDSMIFYSQKMQVSASSPCEHIYGSIFEANATYFKRKCDSSKKMCLEILRKLEQEALSLSDSCFFSLKAHTLGRIVYAEKCQGNYSKALEYISKSKKLINQYPLYSKKYEFHLTYQSALIHFELEQYERTIGILKKETYPLEGSTTPNRFNLASMHMTLGNSYLKSYERSLRSNYLDSAKTSYGEYYRWAEPIKSQTKHTQKLYAIKKGVIALYEKRHDSALLYLQKAKDIRLAEQKHFTNQEIDIYMSEALYHLNQLDSSIYYGNQFLKKHESFPRNNDLLQKGHTILAKAYDKSKQFDKASKHSFLALEEANKMDTLKVNGIEKLNLLNLKKIQSKNQLLLNKKTNKWFIYKIGLSCLIFFLLAFLFHSYRLRKRIKKKYQMVEDLNTTIKEDMIASKENNVLSPTKNSDGIKIDINEDIVNKILSGLNQLEKEKAFLSIDFNLQYIAQKLNSNTSYISKVINHHTGKSFKQYTNNLRIEYITKELKRNPELKKLSLNAIAKDIGYSNASSFSKIFKKNTGTNPSDFIKSLNQEEKRDLIHK